MCGGHTLNRMVRDGPTEKQRLQGMRQSAMWISGGKRVLSQMDSKCKDFDCWRRSKGPLGSEWNE